MVKSNNSGFTIVELLIVIIVIGILAAITSISYTGITNKANESVLISDLSNNSKKLEMYKAQYESYPTFIDNTTQCPTLPKSDPTMCLKSSGSNTLAYVPVLNGSTYSLMATNPNHKIVATATNTAPSAISPVVDSYVFVGSGSIYEVYAMSANPIYFDFNEKLITGILPSSFSSSLGDTYKISFTSGNLAGFSYRIAYSSSVCWDSSRNCIGISSSDLTNGNPTVGSSFNILRKQ